MQSTSISLIFPLPYAIIVAIRLLSKTIGYNKDYLVMVWNGNDNNSNVKSSESKISKKIWANTITKLDNYDDSWYDIPKGITAYIIDPINGELSSNNGYVCYYEKGSEPDY